MAAIPLPVMPEFAGRLVLTTTLDPVPPLFRAVPGYFVLAAHEAKIPAIMRMIDLGEQNISSLIADAQGERLNRKPWENH